MTETVAPEPTPEQAALFARVRRMMLIAGLTTALAVAAVLIAVGYRLFRSGESAASPPIPRPCCRKAPASFQQASPATAWW